MSIISTPVCSRGTRSHQSRCTVASESILAPAPLPLHESHLALMLRSRVRLDLYRLFMWYQNGDPVSLVAPLLAMVVGPQQSSQLHCPRLTRSLITPLAHADSARGRSWPIRETSLWFLTQCAADNAEFLTICYWILSMPPLNYPPHYYSSH